MVIEYNRELNELVRRLRKRMPFRGHWREIPPDLPFCERENRLSLRPGITIKSCCPGTKADMSEFHPSAKELSLGYQSRSKGTVSYARGFLLRPASR